MGLTLVFSELKVLLSHLWEEKKKKEGVGGMKEEGIKKEIRKERKKEFKNFKLKK